MRQNLFIFLGVVAVCGAVLYFVWLCLRDLFNHVRDWRHSRQFGGLRAEREARARAVAEENARRLDNGCEHTFDSLFGALPPDVCSQCGLAKEKPPGDCDHVWRREKGLIPASQCEKCGKQYGGALAEQSTTDR